MIKVKYPVSAAALRADVEGVGPNVVLKQMYYRDNTRLDLSWARTQFACLPSCLSDFFSLSLRCPFIVRHVSKVHITGIRLCLGYCLQDDYTSTLLCANSLI